jgi:AbrB family looped-hinge helix DNA binding protein
MVKRRVNRDKQNRTLIFLPAAIRDKFNLQNGGSVDIETDGSRIIITPLEA